VNPAPRAADEVVGPIVTAGGADDPAGMWAAMLATVDALVNVMASHVSSASTTSALGVSTTVR
jgi:hypothetical protein